MASYLRRFKWIICGEVNGEEEHSTLVGAVILRETYRGTERIRCVRNNVKHTAGLKHH